MTTTPKTSVKKVYQLEKNIYFLVTLSILDVFCMGEYITNDNGVWKYESKILPCSTLEEKPLVEISHRIHAQITSDALINKANKLIDKLL
mgnify:CR=1 FL=1